MPFVTSAIGKSMFSLLQNTSLHKLQILKVCFCHFNNNGSHIIFIYNNNDRDLVTNQVFEFQNIHLMESILMRRRQNKFHLQGKLYCTKDLNSINK